MAKGSHKKVEFLNLAYAFVVKTMQRLFLTWKYTGGIFALAYYSTRDYIQIDSGRHINNSIMVDQIYYTGVKSIRVISVVAFALGAITMIQLFTQLSKVGALNMLGTILNLVIIRELGPLLTAFILIARSGSAITVEIATMMVNDEINAIEMEGINNMNFIVFPRIAGVTISVLLLTAYFNAMGLLGGYAIGNIYAGVTFATFQSYIINSIALFDLLTSFLKSLLFGIFISSIAIYHGFQAFTSPQIPGVTTKSVVNSIFFIFMLDIIVTAFFAFL